MGDELAMDETNWEALEVVQVIDSGDGKEDMDLVVILGGRINMN